MPDPKQDPKLQKLKEYLQLLNDGLTKEDFLTSFKEVLKYVKETRTRNEEEFALIRKSIEQLSEEKFSLIEKEVAQFSQKVKMAEEGAVIDIENLKEEIGNLMAKALKEQESGMNFMRDKVRSIKSPKDGSPGRPGADAQPVDEKKIISSILSQIPLARELTAEDIRNLLEALSGVQRLRASAIDGLEEELARLSEIATKKGTTPGWGAHPLVIQGAGTTKVKVARVINFTGLTVTHSSQGVTTVSSVSGGTPTTDDLSSQAPGTVFTLSHTPVTGTVRVYRGGARQNAGAGNDYTLSGTTVTFANSVQFGEIVVVDYYY